MVQIEGKKKEQLDPLAFAYWLQGFFEISEAKTLSEKQVKVLREHLELIFRKVPMIPASTVTTTSTDITVPITKPSILDLEPFEFGKDYAIIC